MFDEISDSCKRELQNTTTDFAVPHRKSAFGQKCFSHKGAKSWNALSVEVQSSKTYNTFKRGSIMGCLKTAKPPKFAFSTSCKSYKIVPLEL